MTGPDGLGALTRVAVIMAMALVLAACRTGDRPPAQPSLPPAYVAAVSEQYETGRTPGQEIFYRRCSFCHADAPIMPGTMGLGTRYGRSEPAALEKRTDLTPDMIRYFVRNGISVMPGFRKTEISDHELDELVAYLTMKQ